MLTNSIPVWFINPPDFSDGHEESLPLASFDEDYIRSKFLTADFRNHIWRTYYGQHLPSIGNEGSMDDHLWKVQPEQHDLPADILPSSVDWKNFAKPLKVEFFVPLDVSTIRYQKFLLLVGQELRNILMEEGCLRIRSRVHFSKAFQTSSPPLSPRDLDDMDDDPVDVETLSEDETSRSPSLTSRRYSPKPFNSPRPSLMIDTSVESCYEEKETCCHSALAVDDEQLLVASSGTFFKLSNLPDRYRLFERFIIEYPPPPPYFNNVRKYQERKGQRVPRVKCVRSFVVYGHPSGQGLDRSSFAQHLSWLYRVSSENDTPSIPSMTSISSNYEKAPVGCICDSCPFTVDRLSKLRPGEIIWVSSDSLVHQGILQDLFCFTLQDMGIQYWPAELLKIEYESSSPEIEVSLVNFPSFTKFKSVENVSLRVIDSQTILPYSQYRPCNIILLRKLSSLSYLTANIARSFLAAYQNVTRSSYEYYPVIQTDHNTISMLFFGSEILYPGDWVGLDPTSHLLKDLTPPPSRTRTKKRSWWLKIDSMEWRKHSISSIDPVLDCQAVIRGNIYLWSPESHSLSLEVADASVQLQDVLGRLYISHTEVKYPMPVQAMNVSLALSPFVRKHFDFTADPLSSDLFEEDLPCSLITHSHAFTLSIKKARIAKCRLQRKNVKSMLTEYAAEVIDKLPMLYSPPEEEKETEENIEKKELETKPVKKKRAELDLLLDGFSTQPISRTRRISTVSKASSQNLIDILSDLSSITELSTCDAISIDNNSVDLEGDHSEETEESRDIMEQVIDEEEIVENCIARRSKRQRRG